jgi:predicted ArsR family transcriptional regulator
MKERPNLPETSHRANEKMTYEMRVAHHQKIINALSQLGTANYETIANHVGMDKHQVGRRLSEIERQQPSPIYKPGTQSPTKSGRMAMNYCLTGSGMPVIEKQPAPQVTENIKQLSNTVKETEQWFRDYQDGKFEPPQQPTFIQKDLF